MSRRGQTFTLEAVVAAILLLGTVAFSLQVVSISANTGGTADAETANQHIGLGQGVLDEGVDNGTLSRTLLYWDEDAGEFYEADDDGHYIARHPPTAFGNSLSMTFDDRQVRYNVNLYYWTSDGDRGHQPLVEAGTPSDDAVRVVETVTLYDDTELLNEDGNTSATLTEVAVDGNRSFYAPDARPESPIYNVIRVEVVLWRT